jgi:chloramphenicol 3-O phosphotransferase
MKAIAIVLNGASSAGKGTIARAIQELAGMPVLHVSLDMFTDMFHWPSVIENERAACHAVGVANFHAALPLLASGEFPLIVDHVFEQHAWFETCREALKERRTYFIGVRCPLAVLEAREKARGDRRIGLARFQFERVHEQKPYAMEVDTSAHSPTESAAAILKFVEDAEKTNR